MISRTHSLKYFLFLSLSVLIVSCGRPNKYIGEDCPELQGTWYLSSFQLASGDGVVLSTEEEEKVKDTETLTITQDECTNVKVSFRDKTYDLSDIDGDESANQWQGLSGVARVGGENPISMTFVEGSRESGLTVIVNQSVASSEDPSTKKTVVFSGEFLTKKEFDYKRGMQALLQAEELGRRKAEKERDELQQKIDVLSKATPTKTVEEPAADPAKEE